MPKSFVFIPRRHINTKANLWKPRGQANRIESPSVLRARKLLRFNPHREHAFAPNITASVSTMVISPRIRNLSPNQDEP